MPARVLPFRQFVLKVHSRCDLACDHCYVYEHVDQSWQGKPKVISAQVVAQADQLAKKFGLVKGTMLDAASSIGLIAKGAGYTDKRAADLANTLSKLAADASSSSRLITSQVIRW